LKAVDGHESGLPLDVSVSYIHNARKKKRKKRVIDRRKHRELCLTRYYLLSSKIVIELLVSVALFGLGIVLVADDFKEILMETEMAKQ
jgi:hypothetical protein